MYQFTDAIDKVKFDEEFSDVVDNINNAIKNGKVLDMRMYSLIKELR